MYPVQRKNVSIIRLSRLYALQDPSGTRQFVLTWLLVHALLPVVAKSYVNRGEALSQPHPVSSAPY